MLLLGFLPFKTIIKVHLEKKTDFLMFNLLLFLFVIRKKAEQ